VFHAIPAGLSGGINFDQWVAVLAFSYFGLKTLKVGSQSAITTLRVGNHDDSLARPTVCSTPI
jgi:hypothetical protein